MWSAFMNGSGLHGGGGAGGGYVPSQGWEFVPCSRMDRTERGRGKSRSPLRRISSPPTVFSHIYEQQFSAALPGVGGEGGAGTKLEVLRGQMWPGSEPQQQQTQHTRLKKKFEDLKKRHVQDKEEWMREKESLLREVADIQGGENRRLLLDLKTVLDELQAEVKREEEKRSDLQLQYTRDRCAWELEKAELKCRIAQLEARECAGSVSGGVQAGPGSGASWSTREQYGETSTLRREREEQRRLLADTHSTAMDLRCRLEHNERDWSREKAELLERFDVERREWESQLKDMQRKIEELYCEVRAKREGTGLISRRQDGDDAAHRLSIRSTSTGSSLLSENSHSEPLSSSSQSETIRHSPSPALGRSRNLSGSGCAGTESNIPTCFQADHPSEFNIGGQFTQSDNSHPEVPDEVRSRGTWQQESVTGGREAVETTELEEIFYQSPGCGVSKKNISKEAEDKVHVSLQDTPLWAEMSYGSEKKKNTTALNAALKEIARVSEELCSYQDEIRKKSGDKRNPSDSLSLPEREELGVDDAPCDLSQIYDDLRALERENWITLTPDNTWLANRRLSKSWRETTPDPDSYKETQTSLGELSDIDNAAPPIPPRVSSRNLSTPIHPDTELHIPDSPVTTMRRCHSPCGLMDRKCSSPSIVRKFEAMLQENEGKVLMDGVVTTCAVPANSKCNTGCCHNRWSCDASKFTGSKLSAYGTVQKSFSEVSILTAGKHSDYSLGVGSLKELQKEVQTPLIVKDVPVDLLLSTLESPPASYNHHGSKRNIMLEQKTAEFNRTLFQAEMGRTAEEPDCFTVTDVCSVGYTPVFSATSASHDVLLPRDTTVQQQCNDVTTNVTGVFPEATLSLSDSDSKIHNPEVQLRQRRCSLGGLEVKMKQDIPSDSSSQQLHIGHREAVTITPESPPPHSEVKHKVRTASSPSRRTQHKAATEALFSEPVLPVNSQPGQDVDTPGGVKSQPAQVTVSLQQPSAENKQRQMTEPKLVSTPAHQSDSSRPGPRMMNDHPWKPLTLAAYPRPEGSRSNYGAVERILKNYESAAREKQSQSQQDVKSPSPNISIRKEEKVTEVDMLDMDPLPLPPTLRHKHTAHSTHTQLSSHTSKSVQAIHLSVQGQEDYRWNT